MPATENKLEVISANWHFAKDGVSVHDINVQETLACGRFGKYEVEVAAGKLMTFLQERDTEWSSFTIRELAVFYESKHWEPNMMFFGLLGPWLDDCMLGGYRESRPCLAIDDTGAYNVTKHFVDRCRMQ